MRSRLRRLPEGQPLGSRPRGLAKAFSLILRPGARLAFARSRCSSFPAPIGPPVASVYREQAISWSVSHGRAAASSVVGVHHGYASSRTYSWATFACDLRHSIRPMSFGHPRGPQHVDLLLPRYRPNLYYRATPRHAQSFLDVNRLGLPTRTLDRGRLARARDSRSAAHSASMGNIGGNGPRMT